VDGVAARPCRAAAATLSAEIASARIIHDVSTFVASCS
jgi:hypothetical protein